MSRLPLSPLNEGSSPTACTCQLTKDQDGLEASVEEAQHGLVLGYRECRAHRVTCVAEHLVHVTRWKIPAELTSLGPSSPVQRSQRPLGTSPQRRKWRGSMTSGGRPFVTEPVAPLLKKTDGCGGRI